MVTERYAYSAYGTPTITDVDGSTRTTSAENNCYTYTGREYDEALGLYHYRARMYDSVAGKFCSRDPIGYVGNQLSLFGYVESNPLTGVDPSVNTTIAPPTFPVPTGPTIFPGTLPPGIGPGPIPFPPPAAAPALAPGTVVVIGGVVFVVGVAGGYYIAKDWYGDDFFYDWDIFDSDRPPIPITDLEDICIRGKHKRCPASVLMVLQGAVKHYCKTGKRSCDKLSPDTDCDEMIRRMIRGRRCQSARDKVNNRCFNGGDQGHRDASAAAQDVANVCMHKITTSGKCFNKWKKLKEMGVIP